jgi:hypothetical protein
MTKSIVGSSCAAAVLSFALVGAQAPETSKPSDQPSAQSPSQQPAPSPVDTTRQQVQGQTRPDTGRTPTAKADTVTFTGCVANTAGSAATGAPGSAGSKTSSDQFVLNVMSGSGSATATGTAGGADTTTSGKADAGVSGKDDASISGRGDANAAGQAGVTGGSAGAVAGANTRYRLTGNSNLAQYVGKRIEVTGTKNEARGTSGSQAGAGASTMQELRVMSVRVLEEDCTQ